jgi:hypothetical protein
MCLLATFRSKVQSCSNMNKFCAYIWRSPVLLFVITLASIITLGWLAMQSPMFSQSASAMMRAFVMFLAAIPICLMLFGVFDCLSSQNPTNTKLLWVIVMLVAPVLGPLLWFTFGDRTHNQNGSV